MHVKMLTPAERIRAILEEVGHHPRCTTGICAECVIVKRIDEQTRTLERTMAERGKG